MYKFIKTKDESNSYDRTTVTFECDALTWPELEEEFRNFLRACGFVISHDLEDD